jgi:hypothetical protein
MTPVIISQFTIDGSSGTDYARHQFDNQLLSNALCLRLFSPTNRKSRH